MLIWYNIDFVHFYTIFFSSRSYIQCMETKTAITCIGLYINEINKNLFCVSLINRKLPICQDDENCHRRINARNLRGFWKSDSL